MAQAALRAGARGRWPGRTCVVRQLDDSERTSAGACTSVSPTRRRLRLRGRKSCLIFQFDMIAHGRVHLGNDVNGVLVTGPSPRYGGFVELTEASWRLDGPGGALLVSVRADADRAGTADRGSLDAAIRAHALGIATVQAGTATLDPTFVVDRV
jgi:hypothetical protein